MSRLATSIAALVAVLSAPAFAADWEEDWAPVDDFRGGLANEPKDWSGLGDEEDSVAFEFGTRYWYSWGAQSFETDYGDMNVNDNAHTGELHLRIDDYSSRSYAKAIAGYSAVITGSYDDYLGSGAVTDGRVGYAGADIGWNTFGDGEGSGAGVFAGYQYWNDSPRTTRANFVTSVPGATDFDPTTGQIFFSGDSADNDLNINALRLGLSGRAKLDMFDISAEVAAVPYAHVSGILGGHDVPTGSTALGNPAFVKSSETNVNGWGYGAMGEVMVGVTPIENLTFRVGGRAWYLQGTVDTTYSAMQVSDPVDNEPDGIYDEQGNFLDQGYIETANPFSLLRYGLLVEMTYKF